MTVVGTRPSICPDHECEVVVSTYDAHQYKRGYSFHCVGHLLEAHTARWRDAIHINDHSLCIYTPYKGIIRFLMTAGDFEVIGSDLKKALSDDDRR